MALFSFRKNKSGDSNAGGEGVSGPPAEVQLHKRDPRKAKKFFDYAEAVADHDYAIECYINGLRHDPDNMSKHEALHEVAKRRKVTGGKPMGQIERLKLRSKEPLERMLNAELVWAKDPLSVANMIDFMEKAVEADEIESELNLGEVGYWIGNMVLQPNSTDKAPTKKDYIRCRDLFERMGVYDKAVEAGRYAVQMAGDDQTLVLKLKDLEAELTLRKGGYIGGEKDATNFQNFVRDADKQKELQQQDSSIKGSDAQDELLAKRRAEYLAKPDDIDLLGKLVGVLVQTERDEAELEAIQLLEKAYATTQQYRFKMRIGDVKMKRMNRLLRDLRAQIKLHPDDASLIQKQADLIEEKLAFELAEYKERVENYPTDMPLRFELGKRLLQAKRYEDAIAAFQDAQTDPKNKAASLEYLGVCYVAKEWHEEAVETFRQGVDSHPLPDDRLGLSLRYRLMDALERAAVKNKSVEGAREAREIGSRILQTNINFQDIRQRVERLRKLVDTLQAEKGA